MIGGWALDRHCRPNLTLQALRMAAWAPSRSGCRMQKDDRHILEVLKTELNFLELGGYSMRSSRGPQFVFEDTPTCANCGHRDNPVIPCTECVLMDLVPAERRTEKSACRHIPLDASGKTLDSLYRDRDPQELEEAVGNWLRATIDRLEQQRSALHGPGKK